MTSLTSVGGAGERKGSATAEEEAEEEDLGPDEVTLKNGGMVRGTVISVDPGEKVVIKIHGQDKPRIIPWAEVADVDRGKYGDDDDDDDDDDDGGDKMPGYSTPPPKKAEAPAKPAAGGSARVRIESDVPGLTLHRILGQSVGVAGNYVVVATHYEEVCVTPCDTRVDPTTGQQYFFGGGGYAASDMFRLDGKGDDIGMRVKPGSASGRGWGLALGITGVTGVAFGITMLALSTVETTERDYDLDIDQKTSLMPATPGVITLAASVPVALAGWWLFVVNKTRFEFVETKSAFGTEWPTGRFVF